MRRFTRPVFADTRLIVRRVGRGASGASIAKRAKHGPASLDRSDSRAYVRDGTRRKCAKEATPRHLFRVSFVFFCFHVEASDQLISKLHDGSKVIAVRNCKLINWTFFVGRGRLWGHVGRVTAIKVAPFLTRRLHSKNIQRETSSRRSESIRYGTSVDVFTCLLNFRIVLVGTASSFYSVGIGWTDLLLSRGVEEDNDTWNARLTSTLSVWGEWKGTLRGGPSARSRGSALTGRQWRAGVSFPRPRSARSSPRAEKEHKSKRHPLRVARRVCSFYAFSLNDRGSASVFFCAGVPFKDVGRPVLGCIWIAFKVVGV